VTAEDLTRDITTNPRNRRLGNRRFIRLAIIILAIASQVYFLIHFLSHYFTSTAPAMSEYLLLIVVTVVITAIIVMVMLATDRHTASPSQPKLTTDIHIEQPAGLPTGTESDAPSHRPNVIRIVRSCERLTSVEDELIRRVSSTIVDRPTGRLMAEMQICTRRIMKQLEELR
jgi:hypothetical protein